MIAPTSTLIQLNDHYFLSWLEVVKHKKLIMRNQKCYIEMSSSEYSTFLDEYSEIKPVLKQIRARVKYLAQHTTCSVNQAKK
jgi:hypothetical protein